MLRGLAGWTALAPLVAGCVAEQAGELASGRSPAPEKSAATFIDPISARIDAADALFEGFHEPPRAARPWIRWWWSGDAERSEIDASLAALAAAGFAGVERNTVSRPGFAWPKADYPTWLSEAWIADVAYAARGAAERGLGVDLLLGAGWPFGASGLPEDRALHRARVAAVAVTGPTRLTLDPAAIGAPSAPSARGARGAPVATDALCEAWLARVTGPKATPTLAPLATWQRLEANGSRPIEVEVPAGPHRILAVLVAASDAKVKFGVPGTLGAVLDPFHPTATDETLARIERAFAAPGTQDRPQFAALFRAAFVDSFEFGHAAWTADLPRELERRRGYALGAALPAVLAAVLADAPDDALADLGAGAALDPTDFDRVLRAREDWWGTLGELFRERTLAPIDRWCREHGLASRVQAHGSPWVYGLPDGFLDVAIPEGETWIFQGGDHVLGGRDGTQAGVHNLLAASAAHRSGRGLVTCETATNIRGTLRASLFDVEQAAQLSFASGATSLVLHGTTFGSEDGGFPNRIVFGTWFQPANPWWPHVADWTLRTARIQHVLQTTRAATQVALVLPSADVHRRGPPEEQRFAATPTWLPWLWQAGKGLGYALDVVGPSVLDGARTQDRVLIAGAARYELLVLCGITSLAPEHAQELAAFAASGGQVVFLDALPQRAPGNADPEPKPRGGPAGAYALSGDSATLAAGEWDAQNHARDAAVRAAIERTLAAPHVRYAAVPAVAGGAIGRERLAQLEGWLAELFDDIGLRPGLALEPSGGALTCVHHRERERELFLIANLDRTGAHAVAFTLAAGRDAWHWDPNTGRRSRLALPADEPQRVAFDLPPLESAFVVVGDAATAAPGTHAEHAAPERLAARSESVAGPWTIELQGSDGTTLVLVDAALDAPAAQPQPFSGMLVYTTAVETQQGQTTIALDDVRGSVELRWDGVRSGVRFGPAPRFALGDVSAGVHTLELAVATTPFNRVLARLAALRSNSSHSDAAPGFAPSLGDAARERARLGVLLGLASDRRLGVLLPPEPVGFGPAGAVELIQQPE